MIGVLIFLAVATVALYLIQRHGPEDPLPPTFWGDEE